MRLPFRPGVSEELLGRLGSGDVTGAEKSDLSKDDVGSLLKLIEGEAVLSCLVLNFGSDEAAQ